MLTTKTLFAMFAMVQLSLVGCSKESSSTGSGSGGTAASATGATGTTGESTPAKATKNLTFALVSHANAGDKFWDVVKNGEEQAGKDLGVKVTYQGSGDPQKQAQLIDVAVSQKVDGLIVSMANPEALRPSIQKAVQAGIPVITINSGAEKSAELGAMTHVGQTEKVAGEAAGARLAKKGLKHVLCIIHEAGNVGLEERCAGAKRTLEGGKVVNLQVSVSDLASATSTIAAKLQSDPSIDGALTLNNAVAGAAVNAIAQANRPTVALATFDVDATILQNISAGKIFFAIDQQPYLQGYLPVTFLNLYRMNGTTVGGGQPVLTGPGFIDKANAELVQKYIQQGAR
ncbi:sugar ABC transporter substrate-binding protein [Pendulispora brunnea]|uniref:Sugar ABC transporter substrate-binding protein n=1 Tax=Pendulispora brunnea TaxID=2905690 RepID=A0ABZ2K5K8_9BACT